jgi:lycopene beta-cyclase
MKKNFDYIIAGSGLAGLGLLYHLLRDDHLKNKNILIIDPVKKKDNDRTWCFWEKEKGPFEHLVCHQWKTLQFYSHDVSREFEMKHYRYKMIQSGDFYAHVLDLAEKFDNVIFSNEKILEINDNGQTAEV